VRDVQEVLNDPQLADREMVTSVEHPTLGALRVLGIPIKLSETPGAVRTAPPTLGQHTDAILRSDLGLSEDEVLGLRSNGAV
jgi:crotonobetainyl-CoA:carnitine CoA-transferase CaiB-like acyl-CoA transferase